MLRKLRIVVALPLALTFLLVAATTAAAFPPEFGISQSYRNFGYNGDTGAYNPYEDVTRSIYWGPLSVKRLRIVVPWDIAERSASDPRRKEFQHWLDRANELGADPFVVFGPTERTTSTDEAHSPAHYAPLTTYDATNHRFLAPPGSIYKIAMQDFLATWGPKSPFGANGVEEIGAWNEPNRGSFTMAIPPQLTGQVYLPGNTYPMNDVSHCPSGATTSNCGPLMAAWYWEHAVEAMIEACGIGNGNNCEVVAGEFASSAGTTTSSEAWQYWNTYANKINSIGSFTPEIISFHAHRDAEELGNNNVYNEKGEKIGNHDCKSGQTQWCVTTTFRSWMNTYGWSGLMQVWNTETGAAFKKGEASSGVETAQNNRFNWMNQISDEANVRRLYYFNFQGSGTDRGLIDTELPGVDTKKRTIWDTVRCRQTPSSCPGWSAPPAPTVQTTAASGIQITQATINGTVNPNGANTSYHFEYGTANCATNACTKTPASDAYVGNGTSAVGESAPLTGLQPGTTYHYRVVATSSRGTSGGADQTFTTLSKRDSPGVFEESIGHWCLSNRTTSGTGVCDLYEYVLGGKGNQAVAGDWNGDGIDTLGVFAEEIGHWCLSNLSLSGDPECDLYEYVLGGKGNQAVAGDWNGDGIDTLGVFAEEIGHWCLSNRSTSGDPECDLYEYVLGGKGDQAVAGDWNGDGIDTVGVFNPTAGQWCLSNRTTTGDPDCDLYMTFGSKGDQAVAGDWNGDGIDTLGVFSPTAGQWCLSNRTTSGTATCDLSESLGGSSNQAVAGDWDGN